MRPSWAKTVPGGPQTATGPIGCPLLTMGAAPTRNVITVSFASAPAGMTSAVPASWALSAEETVMVPPSAAVTATALMGGVGDSVDVCEHAGQPSAVTAKTTVHRDALLMSLTLLLG